MPVPKTLFDPITSKEIAALIQEEELREKNYEFYCVVDTFDIINYIYPLGLRNDLEDFNDDYLRSEQLTLIDFFDTNDTKPLLFFNEYISEFSRLRTYVERTTNQDNMDFTQIVLEETLAKFIDTNPDKIVKSQALSLIINAAIGETLNSIKKFNGLKKRLRIEESDFLHDNFSEDFVSCFKEIKDSEVAFELLDEIKKLYHPTEDETENDRYHYFLQKYKDCAVVDRVIHINEYLEKNKIKNAEGKQICLLLLSSDASARTLFSKFIDKYCPIIDGKKFQFFRNTGQLFLQLLCDNKSIKNRNDYKSMLKNAHEAALDKEANQKSRFFDSFLLDRYNLKINDVRVPIQINGLKRFFEIRDTLEKSIYTNSNSETIKLFHKIVREAQKKYPTLQNQPIAFKNLVSEHSLRGEFLDSLNKIKSLTDSSFFQLFKGNDPIYGRNHHLPILFNLKKGFQEDINKIVEKLLNIDASVANNNELTTVLNKIAVIYLGKQTYTAEIFLIRAFLFMILPLGTKQNTTNESEATRDLNLGLTLSDDSLKKEFLYALCWANRRNKKYQDAINNAKAGLEIDNTDPRFYHGLALVYYSQYFEAETKDKSLLRDAQENYEQAVRLYVVWYAERANKEYTNTEFNHAVNWFVDEKNRVHDDEPTNLRFIRKNITVILFAIVLMRVLKYEDIETANDSLITEARVVLVKAKALTNWKEEDIKEQHIKYPEYLYNEARLEYTEYTILYKNKEYEIALKKLIKAQEALDKMGYKQSRPEATALTQKINNAIQQLNNSTTQP